MASQGSSVLNLRAVDDLSLIRVIGIGLKIVHDQKAKTLRLGPFDDTLISEHGFFIIGPKRDVGRFRKAVEKDAAAAGIPLLMIPVQTIRHEPTVASKQSRRI